MSDTTDVSALGLVHCCHKMPYTPTLCVTSFMNDPLSNEGKCAFEKLPIVFFFTKVECESYLRLDLFLLRRLRYTSNFKKTSYTKIVSKICPTWSKEVKHD